MRLTEKFDELYHNADSHAYISHIHIQMYHTYKVAQLILIRRHEVIALCMLEH